MGISWWRMAFIFGPAIARGDISSFSLYTPFIFGHLLSRVVRSWKNKVKLRGWPQKVPADQYQRWLLRVLMEICFVFIFLAVCYFMKTEMRSLFNFFLSSFVCPMLRFWFPQRNKGPLWNGTPLWDTTWGNTSVHVLMIGGLLLSWFFQGIDHLFLGFLFLQAIPEIQRRFWMKPVQHVYLVVGILVVCFPFYSIGLMAWYFPSYLEYLPKPYLQTLCWLANARPEIPDYYSVPRSGPRRRELPTPLLPLQLTACIYAPYATLDARPVRALLPSLNDRRYVSNAGPIVRCFSKLCCNQSGARRVARRGHEYHQEGVPRAGH